MLSARLVEGINKGDFPNPNFQGAAIGNGFMHVQKLMNSLVIWSAYHGRIAQALVFFLALKYSEFSADYDKLI